MMKAFSRFGPVSRPTWLLGALGLLFLTACALSPDTEPAPAPAVDAVDVGYGSVEREHLTGSVATLSPGDDEGRQYRTLAEMLRGQAPGLQVSEGVGGKVSVRIRGGSGSFLADEEPLWILDGMPLVSSETLAGLSPNDIDTITVLKDAGATAIYGARGANGVILVKTKR